MEWGVGVSTYVERDCRKEVHTAVALSNSEGQTAGGTRERQRRALATTPQGAGRVGVTKKAENFTNCWWLYECIVQRTTKRKKRSIKYLYKYMVALGNTWLALVCLLALLHSGRHELTAVCAFLLCAGLIAGCSAVLAVRRYCGYRSLVCAFVVCAEEAGSRSKLERKKCCRGKQKNSLGIDPKNKKNVGNYRLRRAER